MPRSTKSSFRGHLSENQTVRSNRVGIFKKVETQTVDRPYFQGDEAMTKFAAPLTGQPDFEKKVISQESNTEAYFGHFRRAPELSRQAMILLVSSCA